MTEPCPEPVAYAAQTCGNPPWCSEDDGPTRYGLWGRSASETGVWGESDTGTGVWGDSDSGTGRGVYGRSNGTTGTGVWGCSNDGTGSYGESDSGTGVWGRSRTGRAGYFEGNVEVAGNTNVAGAGNITLDTGDVVLTGADCAEDFDVSGGESIEPGTVMVIDEEGSLQSSQGPYDKKVAGVVSGAGAYKSGLVLDRRESREDRVPVALMGKVECKVDAQYGPVEVGDLLTTSPTSGHAMKADDPLKAFGAVIGKALRPLKSGRGLIPVLVALQ
jgi:hypothetical protein